jgi:uncharacterized protein (TIGR03083 family)
MRGALPRRRLPSRACDAFTVDSQRLRDCLDADFRRLHEVARATDLHAAVPTCPGWNLADLVRHVGEVYLYKVEMMRLDGHADKWPPEGFNDEPPMDLLGRAYAALIAEFATRRPNDHTFTWYEPDQTVGFWIRDMAQETVIHRVDAELAAAKPIVAIPGDLAADGIDELLVAFVQYDVALRPDKFAGLLGPAGDRSVGVTTPARSWGIEMTGSGVRVDEFAADSADATIRGAAPDVLLWLWNRSSDGVTTAGDAEAVSLLRRTVTAVLGNRSAD